MIRQSNMDHTMSARNSSHPAAESCPSRRSQRDTAAPPLATTLDTPAIRTRRIRQHDEFDLPLYKASLTGDVSAIRKLSPQTSVRRAGVMIAIARAFARVTTGWDGSSFYTVAFDQTLGIWRQILLFSGPILAPSCAVCSRPAVYRLRDTPFCRTHGPNLLDRRAGSPLSDSDVSDCCGPIPTAARDLAINS